MPTFCGSSFRTMGQRMTTGIRCAPLTGAVEKKTLIKRQFSPPVEAAHN